MNRIRLIALLLACSSPAISAYYDQLNALKFDVGGLPNDANFGFSISSVFQNKDSKLVVGAPLADVIGHVYMCDLNKKTLPCELVKLANKSMIHQVADERYNNQYFWLGATVKGTDDFFVACSPLHVEVDKLHIDDPTSGTYGRCYEYDPISSELKQMKELSNVKRIRMTAEKNYTKAEETMDTFGWSVDIASDKSVLVGSPAMSSGRVMKYVAINQNNRTRYQYKQGIDNGVAFNYGYSAASGNFITNKISYAIGSPYGSDGHGKVCILNTKLEPQFEILGKRVGSMFGSVLCTATLSKNRRHRYHSDLLVGAPTYATEDDYNVGAVYVYVSDKTTPELRRLLVGYATNSHFGSAIANLDDLNGDEIDDVAIAAPFTAASNGLGGVVYLYSGAHLADRNADVTPIQTIKPESPNYGFFGYSLTAIKDYDGNGCNELGVGVPSNNLVMVYRCVAAIIIKLRPLPGQVPNDGNSTTHPLKVCFDVKYPKKLRVINAEIKVKMQIEHPKAKLKDTRGFIVSNFEKKLPQYCGNFDLELPEGGNYNLPIKYTIVATQVGQNPLKSMVFNESYVTLSDQSILTKSGFIMASECMKVCEPKLKINQPDFFKEKWYKIGSSEQMNVTVSIVNEGQLAYDACMHVIVEGPPLMELPKRCSRALLDILDGDQLVCHPSHLLKDNKPWDTDISLNMSTLTSENKKLAMRVMVYNQCGDHQPADDHSDVVQLISDYDGVGVTGVTDEGVSDLVNLTRQHIAAKKAFQHVYTISNKGITNWVNVKISVTIQNLSYIKRSIFLASGQNNCELDHSTNTEEMYICLASELPREAGINVKVLMTVVPDELNDRIGKEHLTVHSELKVFLHDREIKANVTSELKLLEGRIEIWIYIVASILALILLVIFFFILRECGFLKRKNKEELKKVRMSVRRQTMMRQSMMQRIQNEDLDALVEDSQPPPEDMKIKKKKDRRLVIDDSN